MNKIALPTQDGFKMVATEDIVRCEADGNYTTLVNIDGSQIVVCRQLKSVEEALPSADFLRVHHSHIVNLNHVDYYVRNGGGSLYLTNGDVVEVSRSRKNELLNRVNLI